MPGGPTTSTRKSTLARSIWNLWFVHNARKYGSTSVLKYYIIISKPHQTNVLLLLRGVIYKIEIEMLLLLKVCFTLSKNRRFSLPCYTQNAQKFMVKFYFLCGKTTTWGGRGKNMPLCEEKLQALQTFQVLIYGNA